MHLHACAHPESIYFSGRATARRQENTMKRTIQGTITLAVIYIATLPAFAHDQSLHKGKATEGVILSVEPNLLVVKTDDGERKITLGETTEIEVGTSKGTPADLKAGAHVAVFGTKLPSGEMVAKEVAVHNGDEHNESEGRGTNVVGSHAGHE